MKSLWTKSLFLVGALALHSHAIFGIGAHWSPALGLELNSDSGEIFRNVKSIRLNEKGTSGLQGFGIKMWIDALPLVDIQLTGNVQFSTYGVDFIMTPPLGTGDTTVPLEIDLSPFPKGKPIFGRMFGDLAILYPFLKIPPLVSLMKIYAGAGVSYGVATEVMSAGFAKKAIDKKIASGSGFNPDNAYPTEIAKALADEIAAAGFKTGAGGFLQIGTQLKPPVVPLAVYLDFKYHFLGFNPSQVGGTAITMEMGAAIAF